MALSILTVIALPEESQGVFEAENTDILYTGVGKINAAYQLTRALIERRYAGISTDLVINLGTAGSKKLLTGSLVLCTKFVQWDMNAGVLGFKQGETPHETIVLSTLEYEGKIIKGLMSGICGTGDSFASPELHIECDIADMEAYALAKVCLLEKVPFMSIKYITNGPDSKAGDDWQGALKASAESLYGIYKDLCGSEKLKEELKEGKQHISS